LGTAVVILLVRAITITPSTGSGGPMVSFAQQKLTVKKATVHDLIRIGYLVRDFQIVGGPAWLNSERFDIGADLDTQPAGANFRQAAGLEMQEVLKTRFGLRVHRETRQLPVYELTILPTGPPMRRSNVSNCPNFTMNRRQLEPGDMPRDCTVSISGPNMQLNQTLDAIGMPVTGGSEDFSSLAAVLSAQLDRNVIDKTGLKGLFDIHLEWNREATAKRTTDDYDNPSLFTAVQEQLGLKLESTKGPVEVLIIDRVENPLTPQSGSPAHR